MKKSIIFKIIALLILFSSCKKDFLSRQPQDAYSNSSLWTSAGDANAALTGVYNGQQYNFSDNGPSWADGTLIVYLDCASDNAYGQYPWEGFQAFGNGSINPTNTNAANLWSYKTIQKCNFFLTNVVATPMDATLKNQMIAQVKFIRAYEYFVMSQLYGDVPLVITGLTIPAANSVTRTPKADVTKFILSELTAAIADLPTSYSAANAGHITKGAALALKARVELYEQDYADCITDCQAVMQLGYTLDPSYQDLFRIQNQANNPEIIAAAQYVENPSGSSNGVLGVMPSNSMGGWASIDPVQNLVDAYEMDNGKPITDQASGYDPANPYKHRDPRLAATILYPGALVAPTVPGGTTSYYDPLGASSPDYYASGNNTSPSGYVVQKYTSHISDFDQLFQSGLNITVIRYAEILLSYAEAKIESGQIDASVYNAINKVRNRAGMPSVDQSVYNTQASLRALVRNERRVEFAFEGLRWFDIQRWKIGAQVMNGAVYGAKIGTVDAATGKYTITGTPLKVEDRVFADKNYLWPVPQSEIDINKNLKQNPGY
ncbi:RagB/SusD family nutrient uptake outer membrane protein [Mucilaginibacter sp. Mucisp86]|uniref:RagB/SusD family nutrient uptake outer membrane protein n=1 Tax=Mucilaginibacter sp. Mucisp86 TaxID=3243060 RepID=UPI0039B368EB